MLPHEWRRAQTPRACSRFRPSALPATTYTTNPLHTQVAAAPEASLSAAPNMSSGSDERNSRLVTAGAFGIRVPPRMIELGRVLIFAVPTSSNADPGDKRVPPAEITKRG